MSENDGHKFGRDERSKQNVLKLVKALKYIVDNTLLQEVIYQLRKVPKDEFKNDSKLNYYCYKIILHCARNMPYPAFYQAWHNPPTLCNPNLNLANLPQIH